MVFHPFFPAIDLSQLLCGTVILISATVAIKKIHGGSKNQFAYVLMSLAALLGIAYEG